MPVPPDPAPASRLPSPGLASAGGAQTPDAKPSHVRPGAAYRASIEAANLSIESDFPITNLSVFDNDLTFQIDCEGTERATVLIVPMSGQELPNVLLSDHPDGPMTPGQPTLTDDCSRSSAEFRWA